MIHNNNGYIPRGDPLYDDRQDQTGYYCSICGGPIWKLEPYIMIDVTEVMHPDCVRDLSDEKLAEMIGGRLEEDDD